MSYRQEILDRDRRFVWHPYTPMGAYAENGETLVIERASGSRLYDADGRSYIDANSSWWCAVLGHDHPRLCAALREQVGVLPHVPLAGIAHAPAAALAEALVARAPAGLSRVFYSDNGSTAVEVAMKLCLQYWHQNGRPARRRFIALHGAFHGETLGATALGGVEVFRRPFASVVLECLRAPFGSGGYAEAFSVLGALLDRHSDEIAGVVIEPLVQAAAGMRLYDPELVSLARELTSEHDVFLVVDEVFTGYGRTGPFWACNSAGVTPDILCTAKGLSGGMLPLGATLASERIFEGFLGEPERAFFYGHTFCGNPLGARLGLEVLQVYEEERILEGAAHKARRIAAAFERFAALPYVTNTRSLGMLGALDLAGRSGYLAPSGQRVYTEGLRRGAYLRPLGNTIYVAPPLNIPDPDLDELLAIVEESLIAAQETRTP